MHRIVLPDLVRLLARVGARRMGDQDLPLALAEAAPATRTWVRDGNVRADAEAAAAVALHVFNATGDRDDGGVLGSRRRAAGPGAADAFRPLLLKQPAQAWLRIALAVDAGALARASHGALAAQARANGEARLLCYRRHPPETRCADAIATDMPRFASALSVDDACALGVGDACVVQAEGRLTASATVAWDGLLAAAVPAVAGRVGGDSAALLVEVAATAQVELSLALHDGISVAIARVAASGDRAFRVVVRRGRVGDRQAGAALGVAAGFADPDALATLAAGALAGVLELPAEALRAIRDATTLRQVPARFRPAATALLARLGIDGADPLETLRERLSALDARLMGRLQDLAGTRAALAFDASYRRLASDAVLFEAELSEAQLRRLHAALLALDVPALLGATRGAVGALVLLHDRSLRRLRNWHVGASLGDWFALESRQRREDRLLERSRVDADGTQSRREYLGGTRYTARANGWSTAYGATFEAVADSRARSCTLHLWWEESRLRADAAGIARIVDDAVLWGVVAADGAPALHARLADALHGVGRCRPRFELELEGAGAAAALGALAQGDLDAWAPHLARALPRNARVPARVDCATRAGTYGAVLAALGDGTGAPLRRRIAASLEASDPRLAHREGRGEAPWTAWQVLSRSGLARTGLAQATRAWSGGASEFGEVAFASSDVSRTANEALAAAFARLRPAFEQPFTLRAVASLLAATRPPDASDARLSLAFERDGEARTLVVGT